MIWILMPKEIDGPMKSPIVFLQTLLFTWESVWKKNESQKSSILEIFGSFEKHGNQKSNEILICSFRCDTKKIIEFMQQLTWLSLQLFMCYKCLYLPSKKWPFLRCEGGNLKEKRFLKIVFLPDFLWILAIFSGKVAILS